MISPANRHSILAAKARVTIEANLVAEREAAQFRASDTAEQARTALQRMGLSVVRASVFDEGAAGWVIGGDRRAPLGDEELIALAARRTASAARVAALRKGETVMAVQAGTNEAEILSVRGLTRERVLGDIEDCRGALGTLPKLAELLSLNVQTIYNVRGGKPVGETLLTALYGDTGGALEPELADLFEPEGEIETQAVVPERAAASTPPVKSAVLPEGVAPPAPAGAGSNAPAGGSEPVADADRFVPAVQPVRPPAQEIVITPDRDLGKLVQPVVDELDKARAALLARGAAIDAEMARLGAERDAVVGRLAKFDAAASVLLELAA